MCKHPATLLRGTRDGIICACGAIFATWAELEEARKEEPAKPESKSVKRRKKATE